LASRILESFSLISRKVQVVRGLDMQPIVIDKETLTIEEVVAIARQNVRVNASTHGEQRVEKARELIAKWVKDKKVIYGITTGFGGLCNVPISSSDTRLLQKKIIMSHATGVGSPLPEDVVRAVMVVRLHDLFHFIIRHPFTTK